MEIYVSNLSYDVTEDDLRNAFEGFGDVNSVQIITDRETGRSRGFAFVVMPSEVEATEAMKALDHAEVDGRRINVKPSKGRGSRNDHGNHRRSSQQH